MVYSGIALVSLAASLVTCLVCGCFGGLAWLWALPLGFLGCFAGIFALLFLFVCACCAVIDLDKPQEEDSPFYRWLISFVVDAILPVVRVKIHTQGQEQLPGDGRFVLVCNHLGLMDPVVLLSVFRRNQLAFISKKENQSMFIIGKIMHKVLCQPIDRENDREALKTILKCIRILKEDKASIAVFPEGYTSKDGLLHHFRGGVFKIPQKAEVPIVVCTLRGTREAFHNMARFKTTHVHLHLVGVIPAQELKGQTAIAVGDRVHAMMAQDLGPELVAPAETEE